MLNSNASVNDHFYNAILPILLSELPFTSIFLVVPLLIDWIPSIIMSKKYEHPTKARNPP